MAFGPLGGHLLGERDVEEGELGTGEDGGGLIGDAAGLDNDPGEVVGDEQEGVEEAGEVEGLESPDVGGRDDDERAGSLDAVLEPLLALDSVDDAVGPHDLVWVGVGPGADADPMAADDHPTPGAVGDREDRRRGRCGGVGEGEGESLGAGGCGGRGGGRGGGAENGGGGVEGGGGEKQEEHEAGEAESEDEADEAAETVKEEPEAAGRGLSHAVAGAAVRHRLGRPVSGDAAVVVVLKQGHLHFSPSLLFLSSSTFGEGKK